jgi:hypothetical protein
VSNGVPAFKPPESRNAAATILVMAALSVTMFVGITLLARAYHIAPSEQETVVSQIARGVFGGRAVAYFLVQAATMLILVLAANTAYADFPRLASILARDRYLPRHVAAQLSLKRWRAEPRRHNIVLVPISGIHRAVVQAVEYAKTLSRDVRAVYVDTDPATTEGIRRDWAEWGQGVPLVGLESPYRSLMEPLLDYVRQVEDERPDDFLTVVLPEFVPARWWHHLFHNRRALLIKGALLFRPEIVVTSVPFHLKH